MTTKTKFRSDRRRHIGDMAYTVVALAVILGIAMGVSGIAVRSAARNVRAYGRSTIEFRGLTGPALKQ